MTRKYPFQVIVNEAGNSWIGTHVSSKKMDEALRHILELSKDEKYKSGEWANAFWLLDLDGGCVAAQSSINTIEKYYSKGLILVHYQEFFV